MKTRGGSGWVGGGGSLKFDYANVPKSCTIARLNWPKALEMVVAQSVKKAFLFHQARSFFLSFFSFQLGEVEF